MNYLIIVLKEFCKIVLKEKLLSQQIPETNQIFPENLKKLSLLLTIKINSSNSTKESFESFSSSISRKLSIIFFIKNDTKRSRK